MLKTVGQIDYSIQEVMHHLLSLKFVSATHEVVTASVDGSRRIQMTNSNTSYKGSQTSNVKSDPRKFFGKRKLCRRRCNRFNNGPHLVTFD